MTEIDWETLTTQDQLEALDAVSAERPVLIYKHSTRCSISSAALNRLERKWDRSRCHKLKACFLDLIAYRAVSDEVASKYGVEHQSPQVLLIQNGRCVYHNSHFGISFEDICNNILPISV